MAASLGSTLRGHVTRIAPEANVVGGDVVYTVVIALDEVPPALRWGMSPRTLEDWRWRKKGPRYLKIGGRVMYRLEDIEAYETAQARDAGAAQRPDVTRQPKATA